VVLAQVGNAFACRTEPNRGRSLGWLSNPGLLRGIAIELAILLALVYIPVLAGIFDHQPIPAVIWIGLVAFPFIIYSLDWMRKWFIRWRERFAGQVINSSVSKEEI
jgi:hypothetical protein